MRRIIALLTLCLSVVRLLAQQQTITIEMQNLNIENYGFMFTASGSTDEYALSLTVNSYSVTGTFTDAEISAYTTFQQQGNAIPLVSRKAVITQSGNDYIVEAELLSAEDILYLITMHYVTHQQETIALEFSDKGQLRTSTLRGELLISAANSDCLLEIAIQGDKLKGNFETKDFDLARCTLTNKKSKETIAFRSLTATAKTNVGGTATLSGEAIGKNDKKYTFSMKVSTQSPTLTDVDVEVSAAQLFYSFSGNGDMGMEGKSDDGSYLLSILLHTPTLQGSFAGSQIDADGSYLGIIGSSDIRYIEFLQGEVTVQQESEGLSLTARMVGEDDKAYHIRMHYAANVLPYDQTTGQVDASYDATTDLLTWYKEEAGQLLLSAKAADNTSEALLLFYVADNSLPLPAGSYPIDNSGEKGTVAASSGRVSYSLTPSYYQHLDTEDGMADSLYFLVAGTVDVTLSAEGKQIITVSAQNSSGRPVHVTITCSDESSALRSPYDASPITSRKCMRGQQVLIRQDNRWYDISGATVE